MPLAARFLDRLLDKTFWKMELGTYVPKVERYGGPGGLAESKHIFFCDSQTGCSVIVSLASQSVFPQCGASAGEVAQIARPGGKPELRARPLPDESRRTANPDND